MEWVVARSFFRPNQAKGGYVQSFLDDDVQEELLRLKTLVLEQDSFTIATHINPDGDAIGSLLGLFYLLEKMGKNVSIAWDTESEIPPQYSFLPGVDKILESSKKPEVDTVRNFIALDCADFNRLGGLKKLADQAQTLINVDHHPENDGFGVIGLLDKDAPACAELVFRLSQVLDVELDSSIAVSLYVGLVTDTGRFQYSNTNARAFDMAQELLRYDISPNEIFQKVYENYSFEVVKLLGLVLNKAKLVSDIGLVYSTVTLDEISQIGAKLKETENLIDSLRGVRKARIAAIFKEYPNNHTKVSLRSKGNTDVERIAARFGGGGHINASGCEIDLGIDKAVEKLIQVIKEEKR